jgi:hypothetical protein
MSLQNRIYLKSKFENDDKPTEQDCIDVIDSFNNITNDGILVGGQSGITAYSGGGQTNAYQLTKSVNEVKTNTSNYGSVKLPAAKAGMSVAVWNNTNKLLNIFPATGEELDSIGINTGWTVWYGSIQYFYCYIDGNWFILL